MTDQSQSGLHRPAEGLRLLRAFGRLRDRDQRRTVMDLVERLARQSDKKRARSSFLDQQDP